MCMMAILVLYKLAAPLLRPFNVVGKFALIKIVVFANVMCVRTAQRGSSALT